MGLGRLLFQAIRLGIQRQKPVIGHDHEYTSHIIDKESIGHERFRLRYLRIVMQYSRARRFWQPPNEKGLRAAFMGGWLQGAFCSAGYPPLSRVKGTKNKSILSGKTAILF